MKKYLLPLLIMWTASWAWAQQGEYRGNPDTSFLKAREMAFKGHREEARDTLRHILAKYPNYNDVRSLLGKTYSWDGMYDKARSEFNKVTSSNPRNKEAWLAAINNERYAGNHSIAMGLANKALSLVSNDPDLMALRSKVLQEWQDALDALTETTEVATAEKNSIVLQLGYEAFDAVYDAMYATSIAYQRETTLGSIAPRINYANRFQENGVQFEVDAYPKFSKSVYAYLNYGYSQDPIFPDHRVGAELYANLPNNMELSLGGRYMDFPSSKVSILTGSLGRYMGDYYVSLRPYYTPQSEKRDGLAGTLMARKYRDANTYMGVSLGMGFMPDLIQLRDTNDELLAETHLYIEQQRLDLEYQFTGKDAPHLYKAQLVLSHRELVFDPGNFVWSVSVGLTYTPKF